MSLNDISILNDFEENFKKCKNDLERDLLVDKYLKQNQNSTRNTKNSAKYSWLYTNNLERKSKNELGLWEDYQKNISLQ